MVSAFWERVRAGGLRVPDDRPLADLTAELTTMLGDPDSAVRDGIACPTLLTWLRGGVYDDLLEGLGDGMASGLTVGLGEDGTDSVFRRSRSALVLAGCIERDNLAHLVAAETVIRWGDCLASWLVRERDLRGFVPDRGRARAVAHGADGIAALAGSAAVERLELIVLLDVLADRLLEPTGHSLVDDEPDRLAAATMRVLRRDLLELEVLEPWLSRVSRAASSSPSDDGRDRVAGNVQAFLRALHLQLALAPAPPPVRSDLLLVLIDLLRESNHDLGQRQGPATDPSRCVLPPGNMPA